MPNTNNATETATRYRVIHAHGTTEPRVDTYEGLRKPAARARCAEVIAEAQGRS